MSKGPGSTRRDEHVRADMFATAQKWSTIRLGIVQVCQVAIALGLAYAAVEVAKALSGSTTHAEFILSFLGKEDTASPLGMVAGIGGILWGYLERRLRKQIIAEKHQRIQTLEQLVDPNRTSARLSTKGDTLREEQGNA